MAKCVIDANNKYKTFVEVNVDGTPKYYTMHEGETMIDAKPPVMRVDVSTGGFVNPTWNGKEWCETATQEEINEWEKTHPYTESSKDNILEKRVAELEEALNLILAGDKV